MKKIFSKISHFGVLGLAILPSLFVKRALAVDPLTWLQQITELPSAGDSLQEFILKIINFAIGFSAIVAVIMIIFAGFKYITANGDENKITSATKTLTFAIVGLVVCFIAVMLVNFVIGEFLLK